MNLMYNVYKFKRENPDVTLEHESDSPKVKLLTAIAKKISLALTFPWKTQ